MSVFMTGFVLVTLVVSLQLLFLFCVNLLLFRKAPAKADSATPRDDIGVSVLIPARDEASRIGPLLDSVLNSQGVQLDVCVLDDESRDGTDAIVSSYAARHSAVRLLRGTPKPLGWSGKQYACWQLAQQARFTELVFLDADVALAPEALSRAVRHRQQTGADLMSGFPRQRVVTLGEQVLIPLIHLILLCFLPFPLMRWTRMQGAAAGCGQFFITTQAAYRASGGHSAIRQSLHDGIMLPRAYRAARLKTDLFDASDMASCRMYTSFEETWHGLLKNATEGFARMPALPIITAVMLLAFLAPWMCLLLWSNGAISDSWLAAVVLSCLASALPRIICGAKFDRSVWGCLLFPVSVLLFLVIQWTAWFRQRNGQPVQWRQRSYEAVTS